MRRYHTNLPVSFLTNQGYLWACAKWVPKLLTAEQKKEHVRILHLWEKYIHDDSTWFDKVIITDESYVSFYDPFIKQQSNQWVWRGDPSPKKQKSQHWSVKVLVIAIAFFDKAGMVYIHVRPQNLWLYTHGLKVLITALVKHWYLGKLQVYMFCLCFEGKLWGFTRIHERDF